MERLPAVPDPGPDDLELDVEPLGAPWSPTSMVEVPAELVIGLAMGLEDPQVLARRHGFTAERWAVLSAWKPFLDAVAAQRTEFERSGLTFRLKAAMKADLLADQVFVDAMTHTVPLTQRMEALRLFSRLGNLEPKEDKQAVGGPAFQIHIDLGERSVSLSSPTEVVDALPPTPAPAPIAR